MKTLLGCNMELCQTPTPAGIPLGFRHSLTRPLSIIDLNLVSWPQNKINVQQAQLAEKTTIFILFCTPMPQDCTPLMLPYILAMVYNSYNACK